VCAVCVSVRANVRKCAYACVTNVRECEVCARERIRVRVRVNARESSCNGKSMLCVGVCFFKVFLFVFMLVFCVH